MARVNIDLKGVKKKLGPVNLKRGRYALANQALADMNQFVPMDQTPLRQTGHASNDGKEVIWVSPYAKPQFYGTNGRAVFKKYTTPGTGPRWDLKAKRMFMSSWINTFKDGAGW